MCGNSSMSFVLQVWRLQVNGQGIGAILLFVEVVNLNGAFFFLGTEEEASNLRFFVDEPAYTDLHWVSMFLKWIN